MADDPGLIEQVRVLWNQGASYTEIGVAIGKTRNAAAGICHRAGLQRKKQAITPAPKRPPRTITRPPLPLATPAMEIKPAEQKRLGAVTIVDLQDHQCRWVLNQRHQGMPLYCGKQRIDGSPYCKDHRR